jgi:hypothetical protein
MPTAKPKPTASAKKKSAEKTAVKTRTPKPKSAAKTTTRTRSVKSKSAEKPAVKPKKTAKTGGLARVARPASARAKSSRPKGARTKQKSPNGAAPAEPKPLSVTSAGFYRKARLRNGQAVVAGAVKSIVVQEFPAHADMLGLSFVIDFQAPGRGAAAYAISLKLGSTPIYETAPQPLQPGRHARGEELSVVEPLRGFLFPDPGIYLLNFIYDGAVIRLEPLELARPKAKAVHYRR